jgi:membrane protein required for colicin V production
MNWLDVVIIVFLVITTFTGLSKGFIKSIIPLVGIVIGIVLAGRFYGSVADWLSTWLHSSSQANIAGFAIIFVVVVIISLIIASLLSKFLSLLFLGFVDKLAGAGLGFVTGSFICGAILTLITKYNFPGMSGSIHNSNLASFFVGHFNMVLPFLPKEFDSVRQFFD